ncbi:MAG: hypothetical protein ACRDZY_14320, partial [Acidimicrobiales bacterium]
MSPRQWPNPRDTALDRRSAIARSYRAALLEVAPGRCLALDRAVIEFREASWLMPSRDTTEGLRLSTGEVAELCGVSQSAVRNWA